MYAFKRTAFAMMLAIFVIVLIAGAGALIMNNSALTDKSISKKYLHTQALLLADSATEFAVMRAQDVNTTQTNQCLRQLNITAEDASGSAMFDINVTLHYVFRGIAPASCETVDANLSDLSGLDYTMILVDTTVIDRNLSTEPIRVHKRTWQKL